LIYTADLTFGIKPGAPLGVAQLDRVETLEALLATRA
jgi:hypothetical protein